MLLRNIMLNVKEQNWTAIVIDFFIVVVGVFFGIQVSNWNEVRKQQEESVIYTQRLTTDLLEEAWNYQYLIEYYQDVHHNAEIALNVLEGGIELSDEQFLIAAYRATQFSLDTRRSATFDELKSTGKLELIANSALRETAMRVYSFPLFDMLVSNGRNGKYRESFRQLIPISVQQTLLNSCGDKYVDIFDYQGIKNSLDYPCTLNIDEKLITLSVNTLKEHIEVLYHLRLRFSQLQSNISSLTIFYPEVREGLAILRKNNQAVELDAKNKK